MGLILCKLFWRVLTHTFLYFIDVSSICQNVLKISSLQNERVSLSQKKFMSLTARVDLIKLL
jgi:hypothetical protein